VTLIFRFVVEKEKRERDKEKRKKEKYSPLVEKRLFEA